MKRAFTLIELLVVIAIIAILAAILFPVFAQAKNSAKAAASLSNDKQEALAVIMYEADTNDYVPPATCWDTGNDPLYFGSLGCSTWVWMVQPYVKNGQLFQDPLVTATTIPTGWTAAAILSLNPTYGYDYTALSPYAGANPGTAGCVQTPISATAPARPADMVLIASKWSQTEASGVGPTTGVSFSWNSLTGGNTDDGPMLTTTVDAPNCYTIAPWCMDNWGENSQFATAAFLLLTDAHGANTGGMTFRAANNGITTFMDGHAKKQSAGFLAAGTNWYVGLDHGSLVENNASVYHWAVTP